MPNLLVPVIKTSALRITSSGYYTVNKLFYCSNKSSSFSCGFVIKKLYVSSVEYMAVRVILMFENTGLINEIPPNDMSFGTCDFFL